MKRSNNEGYPNNIYLRKSHEAQNKTHNNLFSLSNKIECYKCNNFGLMAKDCRLIVLPREPKHNINNHKQEPQRIWRRKKYQFNTKECPLALQAQHKKSGWYVDNGCSNHMTGDKNVFLTLRKE
jgi:hypothetical protein